MLYLFNEIVYNIEKIVMIIMWSNIDIIYRYNSEWKRLDKDIFMFMNFLNSK